MWINHRYEMEREVKDNNIPEQNRSVASGRAMEQIAAGKGKAPKPFMSANSGSGKADAVWQSNRGDAAEARSAKKKSSGNGASHKAPARLATVASIPDFVEPQLCTLLDRPPGGEGWGHEIKLDGYRVQLRVEDGRATLKTRKGLDWTEKFSTIAEAGSALPDALIDGEGVALDDKAEPNFAALQAALSDGRTDNLMFYAFDLLFVDEYDLRRQPLSERKRRLKELLGGKGNPGGGVIHYLDHLETGGEAVWESACKMSLEGIVSKRLGAPYYSG